MPGGAGGVASATCPGGTKVVGVGFSATIPDVVGGGSPLPAAVALSMMTIDPGSNSASVRAFATSSGDPTDPVISFTAHAFCAALL